MTSYKILDFNTTSIQYLRNQDKRLAKVIEMVGPITYTLHDENPYSFLVHEIIEQMLSAKAGNKIYERLEILCLNSITPEHISQLSNEQLRNIGTSNAKVNYIRNLTNAINSGFLCLNEMNNLTDSEIIRILTSISGIGPWTAKMFLLFVLDRPDILPAEDGAFLQTYRWVYKTTDCSEKAVIQ